MPRTLSADVIAEKGKEYNRPVELYRIYLNEMTLYLAMYPIDIDFFDENGSSKIYQASAIDRSEIETNIEMKVPQFQITIDNVVRDWSAYAASTDLIGRKIEILKVFLDANGIEGAGLTNPENEILLFSGTIDAPVISEQQISITVTSKLDLLNRKLPARTFSPNCPWIFGDPNSCGVTVPKKTGTIGSISADHLTVYISEVTELSNYWKCGELTIGSESRLIESSANGSITVEYPFSANVAAGDTYNLEAGCDKTWDGSHGCERWNNTALYGGFLSIPRPNDIRKA